MRLLAVFATLLLGLAMWWGGLEGAMNSGAGSTPWLGRGAWLWLLSPVVASSGVVWILDQRFGGTQGGARIARSVLTGIAILVVELCLCVQMKTDHGWFSLIGVFFLWPVVAFVHIVAHSARPPRSGGLPVSRTILITLSHLLFIAGFLLQYDAGDSSGSLTITGLFGHRGAPAGWPGSGNFIVFLPVLVTWYFLIRHSPQSHPRFAQVITAAAIIMIAAAIVAAEAMHVEGVFYPANYAVCLWLAFFPLVSVVLSRRWNASSRFRAFLLGWFVTLITAELSAIVIYALDITGAVLGTGPLLLLPAWTLLHPVLSAIVATIVGLIRAFAIMPKPVQRA
jgi:hypothetical protein